MSASSIDSLSSIRPPGNSHLPGWYGSLNLPYQEQASVDLDYRLLCKLQLHVQAPY